jgi:hypothetical protein
VAALDRYLEENPSRQSAAGEFIFMPKYVARYHHAVEFNLTVPIECLLTRQDASDSWSNGVGSLDDDNFIEWLGREATRQGTEVLSDSLSFSEKDPGGIKFDEEGITLPEIHDIDVEVSEDTPLIIDGRPNPGCKVKIEVSASSSAEVRLWSGPDHERLWEEADSRKEAVIVELRKMIHLDEDLPLNWKYSDSPNIYLDWQGVVRFRSWWSDNHRAPAEQGIERPEKKKINFRKKS